MNLHLPIIRHLLFGLRHEFVIDDRRTYRGLELAWGACHVAAAIRKTCSTKTVGLMLPTSGAFPISALGGWMAGKTIVPLNYLLKPEELQYVVDDCDTDTIITVKPMLDHLGGAPKVKNLMMLDELPLKKLPPVRWPKGAGGDDLAALLYTSGTSGRPKGVMLSHGNLRANVEQVKQWVNFGERDTFLGVLPQFHSFGLTVLTLVPLFTGSKVVYSARFVPAKIIKLFREHRPTVFIGIPSMFNALMTVKDAGPEDFESVRYIVSGGEPLPEGVAQRFKERFGVPINEGYGMTETSPVTNWCRPEEYRPRSVGPALKGVDQKIIDPASGDVLPANTDGELRMKGPNVMKGYYKLPEQTAEVFDEQGYLRTGDMARLDDDGHLYITGRIKEMLIVGGENVFPREIEEVLDRHKSVFACGVIGQMDPVRGEVPVAFVQLEEGAEFDEKALIRHCRESLAGYKVPKKIVVLDELPRNPTGKVLRRALKDYLPVEN